MLMMGAFAPEFDQKNFSAASVTFYSNLTVSIKCPSQAGFAVTPRQPGSADNDHDCPGFN
jgi:hypothetical protein